MNDLLIPHFDQHQPGVVPAPVAFGIIGDAVFGVVEGVAAESVISRQAAELIEEVVRCHVVRPGSGHGFLEGELVFVGSACGYTLDSAEFREGVDAMGI